MTVEPPETATAVGIIGTRQLVAVQTFDIARLTSHPVVLVPGTFIAVGGRGPTDSNESGKTSFLAAAALLLGDPGWGMTGGGPSWVADLLFEPRTAGVHSESYAPARHGYIVGAFCDPDNPDNTVMTVWCRLNATAEYFQVRYADGLHLVGGGGDRERHAVADAAWATMPTATQLGSKFYAERLYGDSPRCLAYVSERGKHQSKPSLLQMNAGQFTPQQIGEDLIRLTGRAGAFTAEADHSEKLDEAQRKLQSRENGDVRARQQEDEDLRGVRVRNTSRQKLGEAEDAWRLHFALGYLDVLEKQAAIEEELSASQDAVTVAAGDVGQAERAVAELSVPEQLKEASESAQEAYQTLRQAMQDAAGKEAEEKSKATRLEERERELDDIADGWRGGEVAAVAQCVETAKSAVEKTTEAVGVARGERARAEERLLAAETGAEGAAGETAALLVAQGVPAAPLMDLELADRDEWEQRLALYRDAVVVTPGRIHDAVDVCASRAGAVLIDGLDGPLPGGVASAPAGASRFLSVLARLPTAEHPARALHEELRTTVIGGFAEPQAGRAVRVARARLAVAQADAALEAAKRTLEQARANEQLASADLRRAEASEQLDALRAELSAAMTAAADAAQAVADLVAPLSAADDARTSAAAKVESHEALRAAAEDALRTRRKDHATAENERDEVRKRFDSLPVAYWSDGWGGSSEAAADAVTDENRTEKALRNRAAIAIREALIALGINTTSGDGAPTPELTRAAQRGDSLFDDPDRTRLPALEEVGGPLRDHLEAHEEQDLIVEDRTTRMRQQREAELNYAREECERLERTMLTLQDAVEDRIRHSLKAISAEYDRLSHQAGRWGADLDIQVRRPEGPQDRWEWSVTPRWRRAPGGKPLPYTNQANSAQKKVSTVQLVLAALLAAPNPRGRVMILDELGDSLGISNRREVLREIAFTAEAMGVTVLGTCQDAVLPDATAHCGELLYFQFSGVPQALNRPTRAMGFDDNRERVDLTAHVLQTGRPWL